MNKNEENYVVGIGEVLWDVLPDGKKIGGAPANFAYHVSQFGLNGLAVSAVGDDVPGDEIIDVLNRQGLGHHLERVGFPTGTVEVSLDSAGVPKYDIKENVAWDNIHFTKELGEIAAKTKAVCFGSLAQRNPVSRKTIQKFLSAIPAGNDTLRVFDINLRQDFFSEEVVRQSIGLCDVLKINDEELNIVKGLLALPDGSQEELCETLMSLGDIRTLILTCGVDGSKVFSNEGVSVLGTPKVEVADTVGAGDSFTAAFVASILKGKSARQAHRVAVDVSAFVCSRQGAMPPLPTKLIE